MRVACEVTLTDDERKTLTQWSRGRSTPARLVLRGKIVLLAAEGRRNDEIALELGTARKTVGLWRNRFVAQRLAGLEKDAPRPGRSPKVRTAVAQQIIEASTRGSAVAMGLEAELGTIEVGKVADLLVVQGDPLADLSLLAKPLLVVHDGRIVDP